MSTRADEALRQTEQTTRRKAAACRSTGFWQATMDGAHFRGSLVGSRSEAYLTVEDCLTRLSLKSAPQRSQCCLGRRQSGFGFLVRLINHGVGSYRWVAPLSTSPNADRFDLQPSLVVCTTAQPSLVV